MDRNTIRGIAIALYNGLNDGLIVDFPAHNKLTVAFDSQVHNEDEAYSDSAYGDFDEYLRRVAPKFATTGVDSSYRDVDGWYIEIAFTGLEVGPIRDEYMSLWDAYAAQYAKPQPIGYDPNAVAVVEDLPQDWAWAGVSA